VRIERAPTGPAFGSHGPVATGTLRRGETLAIPRSLKDRGPDVRADAGEGLQAGRMPGAERRVGGGLEGGSLHLLRVRRSSADCRSRICRVSAEMKIPADAGIAVGYV
jgi:hypothetical protein